MQRLIDKQDIHESITLLREGKAQPFSLCKQLADSIGPMMERGEATAGDLLSAIADIYHQTQSNSTKAAIDNCFLYRLGTNLFSKRCNRSLLGMLPESFYCELVRQMTTDGP